MPGTDPKQRYPGIICRASGRLSRLVALLVDLKTCSEIVRISKRKTHTIDQDSRSSSLQLLRARRPELRPDVARIHNQEHHHDRQHQNRIEHVDEPLILHDIAVAYLEKLQHPDDRTHHDKDTRDVQSIQVLLTHIFDVHGNQFGGSPETVVEEGSHDGEEAEEDDLHDEADHDNFLSIIDPVDGLARYQASACIIVS